MAKIEPNPLVDLNNARNLPKEELRWKDIFPHASIDFIEINTDRGSYYAKPESLILDGPDGKAKRKEAHSGRYVISVTAYRARLCDPDNLCAKYFIDSLRYAGIIPDDREEDIIYSIRQKKVAKAQEKTLIEIWLEKKSE